MKKILFISLAFLFVSAICGNGLAKEGNHPRIGVVGKQLDGGLKSHLSFVDDDELDTGPGGSPFAVPSEQAVRQFVVAYVPNVKNVIKNSAFAVWSSGTAYAIDASASPDGWSFTDIANTGSNAGATKVNLADVTTPGSGQTEIYPGLTHSALITSDAGVGVSDYWVYPDENSGLSVAQTWYRKFVGRTITFGALVYTDSSLAGDTNYIRPYISTANVGGHKGGTVNGSGVTRSTFGDYASGGWQFLSASTTVPNGATALEFGWQIFGTALSSSPTAYVCGPTLISGNTVGALQEYIPVPNEVVDFKNFVPLVKGGNSTFGVSAEVYQFDLSANSSVTDQQHKISDDVDAVYIVVAGDPQSTTSAMYFYGDSTSSGVSMSGVSNMAAWAPVSSSGVLNMTVTNDDFDNCSIDAVKAKVR